MLLTANSKCCILDNWTETSPVVYDTALRISMTWMTENLHQLTDRDWRSGLTASVAHQAKASVFDNLMRIRLNYNYHSPGRVMKGQTNSAMKKIESV